ncbi:MAG: hypothetical protein JHC87_08260, partial [Thermoleophilaceae bacterium]|nr:hypothetical protein [Thermoleophilaceae bacterium]
IEAEPADATTTLEEYREQVGRIGRSLFEVFMRDPELGRVLFFVVGEVGSDLREQVAKAFDYFTLGTELYLKNGIERGFINPKIDTFATAAALNLLIFEGARRLEFADDPSAETDRWIATAQMLLFDGISAERRSGR